MSDNIEYLYSYRSIEKLFKFHELENLEIYFSKRTFIIDGKHYICLPK